MSEITSSGRENTAVHQEKARFPSLEVVDLKREASRIEESYKNFPVLDVNNHCLRIAVMQGEYPWHQHPRSDECFLVLEGELELEIADGRAFQLRPGEVFKVPAGVVHRTRARARTVNLCFEDRNAYADAVFQEPQAGHAT